MTTMNQGDLAKVDIPLPSLAEQHRISDQLDEKLEMAQKIIDATKVQLDSINALPAAYLRRAFRGEL
jgi:restriction endonuclease S subunit